MRQKSRFFILSLSAATIISFPQASLADGEVTTDFVFQLDNSVFQEFDYLKRLQGHEVFAFPDTTVGGEVPASITGVSAEVAYKLKAASEQIVLGADQALVSESISLNARIGRIAVDAVVNRWVGDTLIQAHVRGSCENIPLVLQAGKAQLMGSIRTGIDASGLPTLSVPWLQTQVSPDGWIVGEFSCQGPEGFKALVQQGLMTYLSDVNGMTAALKSFVDGRVARYQAELRASFLAPRPYDVGIKNLKVTMTPMRIQNLSGDKFQLVGRLAFVFMNPALNETISLGSGGQVPKTLNLHSLLISGDFLNAMNNMAYKAGIYVYRKRGQEIAGFRNLLNSRFIQFFVWPELGYFAGNAEFLFDVIASERPRMSRPTDARDGSVLLNVKGSVSVLTWAPFQTGFEPMVSFNTPVSGTYRLWLEQAAEGAVLRATFTQLSLRVSAAWDGTYSQNRLHNSYISASSIQGGVSDSLQSDGFSFPLGHLNLGGLSLTPVSLGLEGGWLNIDWK